MARDTKHLAVGMDLLKPGFAEKYQQKQAANPTGRTIRVGRLSIEGTDPAIDQAVDAALRRAGFRVVRLSPRLAEGWERAKKHGRIVALADGYESDHHLLDEKGVTFTTKTAILLGKVPPWELGYVLATQGLWVAFFALLSRLLYLRGLRRYGGYGG